MAGGALRRDPKPKPDIRTVRYQRVMIRIKSWETKLKRAETALKGLYGQRAYYEKS